MLILLLFPVLLRVFLLVGLSIWRLLNSLGAGLTHDVTCRFSREGGTGSRRDFFVGCPGALAASQACYVTDRWFTPHFSVLARIGAWMTDVACPSVCQLTWPACRLNTCLGCLSGCSWGGS